MAALCETMSEREIPWRDDGYDLDWLAQYEADPRLSRAICIAFAMQRYGRARPHIARCRQRLRSHRVLAAIGFTGFETSREARAASRSRSINRQSSSRDAGAVRRPFRAAIVPISKAALRGGDGGASRHPRAPRGTRVTTSAMRGNCAARMSRRLPLTSRPPIT